MRHYVVKRIANARLNEKRKTRAAIHVTKKEKDKPFEDEEELTSQLNESL